MNMNDNIHLARVSDCIPMEYRSIFEYDEFNKMQTLLLHQVLDTRNNIVVAAPTGSGKTVIHELAILQHLIYVSKKIKCVLITPNKALCQQRMRAWEKKFNALGLAVLEVTGDVDLRQGMRMVAMASIIITTPEKWDSLTRMWKHHVFLLGSVDLLLLDEVHHLGEERGATLEALVVRMRMLSAVFSAKTCKRNDDTAITSMDQQLNSRMRVIALSATLPNLVDIGEWLNCEPSSIHYFDESYRPVPLITHTLALGSSANPYLFERSLDERVPDIIRRYSEGKQVLIFCATKKGTETLCGKLKRMFINKATWTAEEKQILMSLNNQNLHSQINNQGVAYHHSGLHPDDRLIVEQFYLSGKIHCLCSTSTLAHGVNLPAHLVIVKGTNCWRGGTRGYEPISKSDIIQMLGRAGRPGFDQSGVAVIMTSVEERSRYESISLHADVVESTLKDNMIEAICSEISQNVICSVDDCLEWMRRTFFYIRARRDPAKYGFHEISSIDTMKDAMRNFCSESIGILVDSKIIIRNGSSVQPDIEASIMTKYMIKFRTMTILMGLDTNSSMQQLLNELSNSDELHKPVRRLEKRVLNEAMKMIRFPLKQRVQDSQQKAYVLLQSAVARVDCITRDFSLKVEQAEIVESALRILGALTELCKERSRGPLLEKTILLDRALHVRMWETRYGSVFYQCRSLSDTVRSKLSERGIRTAGDLLGLNVAQIQALASCSALEADCMLKLASDLNWWHLEVRLVRDQNTLKLEVCPANSQNDTNKHFLGCASTVPLYQLLCYHLSSGRILCYRQLERGKRDFSFRVPLPGDVSLSDIYCVLLSDYVGIDSIHFGTKQRELSDESDQINAEISTNKKKKSIKKSTDTSSCKLLEKEVIDSIEPEESNSINKYFIPQDPQWDSSFADKIDAVEHIRRVGSSSQALTKDNLKNSVAAYKQSSDFSGNMMDLHFCRSSKETPEKDNIFNRFRYDSNQCSRATCDQKAFPSTQFCTPKANTPISLNDSKDVRNLRSKAIELQLDTIPVKRLRSSLSHSYSLPIKSSNNESSPDFCPSATNDSDDTRIQWKSNVYGIEGELRSTGTYHKPYAPKFNAVMLNATDQRLPTSSSGNKDSFFDFDVINSGRRENLFFEGRDGNRPLETAQNPVIRSEAIKTSFKEPALTDAEIDDMFA